MKVWKRLLSIIMCVFLTSSLIVSSAVALTAEIVSGNTVSTVKETVSEFLHRSTQAVYFYKPQNIAELTIMDLPDAKRTNITAALVKGGLGAKESTLSALSANSISYRTTTESSFLDNLRFHEDGVAYYSHIYETLKITYSWFNQQFCFSDIIIADNTATVDVYQRLDYQYSDYDKPTMEIIRYQIVLANSDDTWYVAAVDSDNEFYQCNNIETFNLDETLNSYDQAWNLPENVASREAANTVSSVSAIATPQELTQLESSIGTLCHYDGQSAANYAYTYSTPSDDRNNPPSIPTFKNDFFNWPSSNNSCMLFASQCVWAGFGGSNTLSQIQAKYGMDDDGSATNTQWYSTDNNYTDSWASCWNFREYVYNSRNLAGTQKGLICDTLYVAPTSSSISGIKNVHVGRITHTAIANGTAEGYPITGTISTPFSASQLIGAVIHVNGNSTILGHAVVCTDATSLTRDGIYFTAYNNTRFNKNLTAGYGIGTYQDLFIIVPKYFTLGGPHPRLYAELEKPCETNTFVDLIAHCSTEVEEIRLNIFPENSTVCARSFLAENTNVISATLMFPYAGVWRVEVVSPGVESFTYTVRVLDSVEDWE